MKSSLIVMICLLFMITLIGCQQELPTINPDAIQSNKIEIDEDNRGMKVTLKVDLYRLNIDVDEIVKYGIIITQEAKPSRDEFVKENGFEYFEKLKEESNSLEFIIPNILTNMYNTPYYIRGYIQYNDNQNDITTLYSSTMESITLYTLAKKQTNEFALDVVAIVENKMIDTIEVTINTKDYLASTTSNAYQVELETDYNTITITITLNSGYRLSNEISLIANNQTIASNKYTFTRTTIIYIFDDPNWTKPY